MLEDYPGFGVTREGDVWRTTPVLRGRYAGRGPGRLQPSIHPRGHLWYVHLRNREDQRVRIAIRRLLALAFGD